MKALNRISISVLIVLFLTVALSYGQDTAEEFLDKGLGYTDKGQHDKAISEFNKAIALNPRYVIAYNNRGVTYGKKAQYDKAISDFSQAKPIAR
jgi:tetratricopeptide (TPR) repeat protein